MLPSIGPKEQLSKHSISTLYDSPEVGENYQDHLEVSVYGRAKQPISLLGSDKDLKALSYGFQLTYFIQMMKSKHTFAAT